MYGRHSTVRYVKRVSEIRYRTFVSDDGMLRIARISLEANANAFRERCISDIANSLIGFVEESTSPKRSTATIRDIISRIYFADRMKYRCPFATASVRRTLNREENCRRPREKVSHGNNGTTRVSPRNPTASISSAVITTIRISSPRCDDSRRPRTAICIEIASFLRISVSCVLRAIANVIYYTGAAHALLRK